MNLVKVFHPYGDEHGCVSSRAGAGASQEHYRFQYTELQSKDDEAGWRETPAIGAGVLFITT
jgi:hypothetical protein